MPTLLGQSLFPADNPWNQQITNAPVAANSTAIINNIITNQKSNGQLHPDFGQDTRVSSPLYGIPYNVVHGNSVPKVHVVIDAYPGESDLQNAPLVSGVVIEGDMQNGPTAGLANRGDSHLIVWDEDNNVAYEFYQASRPSENADGNWHANQESVWDMKTNTFRTLGWTSADAAGLAILPGLVRPDEGLPASQGGQGVINHAIRFTLQNSLVLDQFIYPASHTANPGNTNAAVMPPLGARFRLKAGVDISALNPESRVIAQAMKDYGMILADNGSNFFFSGASYSVDASNHFALTWNDSDIQDALHGLKSLHFSDFEVVDLTPVVTGLSVTTGPAGTSVTVTGQNFSGAAGHLQVLFGGVAATSVTVVDDAHVIAVAPAGTGTVDVQVQSGATNTTDAAENFKAPVFGYGTSAVVAADKFTYTSSGVTVNPASLPNWTVNQAGYSQTLTGSGGTGSYTFAVTAGGLPTGLGLNGTTGAVTGTPTAAGTFNFTITATDSALKTGSRAYSVVINAALAITTTTLAAGTVSQPGYSQAVATSGGTAPLTFAVTSGALPGGLGLNSSTGAITGTPTAAGTFNFTVKVTDRAGASASKGLSIVVKPAPAVTHFAVSAPASAVTGTAITFTVTALDATNAVVPGYSGTVRFSSSDGRAALPGSAALVNGTGTFAATFNTTGPQTVTAADTVNASLSGTSGAVTVAALPAPPPPPPAQPPAPPPAPAPRRHILATGTDRGGPPEVHVYDAASGALLASFDALPAFFTGGLRVAVGDVNGDGTDDIVVGAGPGAAPQVTVFDGTTFQPLRAYMALPSFFTGGVFVAAGDVNGDGFADVVSSADAGGGPQVAVQSGRDGSVLANFYATAPFFTGGIRVTCGDLNGDGFADVVAAAGPGAGPQVTVFDGRSLSVISAFYAFAPFFTGGMYIAVGDVTGDGRADIVAGADKGGGPQVTLFNGPDHALLASFYALPPFFTGGVRVALADRNGDGLADIVTAAGPGGGPQVASFDAATLDSLGSFFAYAPGFTSGLFLAGR